MKKLSLILVGALILGIPSIILAASPISLTVTTAIPSGTNLGTQKVFDCPGYKTISDPFIDCSDKGAATTLKFHGKLETDPLVFVLYDTAGNPKPAPNGAGVFYALNYNIVYLYPDAWGGVGYQLSQNAAGGLPIPLQNSLVMTPVYSDKDKFQWPDLTYHEQGILIAGEVKGPAVLAKNGGSILTARRARIVRAEYGIPPSSLVSGWAGIPLTTSASTYTGGVTITLTQI